MFPIVLILSCSIVLFAYWFRYSCLLILQTRMRESTPNRIAVERSGQPDLAELTRNYRMMRFMLSQATELNVDPIERRMLLLDYQLMRIWYLLTHRISDGQARHALEEMSTIVNFFGQGAGIQAGRIRV